MNESHYNQILDDLMIAIEDAIDESGIDIDYENAGGILTLTCQNNSKLIFSRQTSLQQLWVAAKSGGFHFVYNETNHQWYCDNNNNEPFASFLNRCLSEQSGEKVTLAL